jgi:integrase
LEAPLKLRVALSDILQRTFCMTACKAPVPMVPLLAGFIRQWQKETTYGQATDWVFASIRPKGKSPRVANMLVEDYLRPAAVKAGVLNEGEKVRFGFHNLRHSLASFLVRKGTDAKTCWRGGCPN